MGSWQFLHPAPPALTFQFQASIMDYAAYVPDQYPLQLATYRQADIDASGQGQEGGWRRHLTRDTYPPGTLRETVTPSGGVPFAPAWPSVSVGAMILEQAQTADCLPWIQTQWQGQAAVIGVTPPIPAGSRVQVRVFVDTNTWRTGPQFVLCASPGVRIAPDWNALLAPMGFDLVDLVTADLRTRTPPGIMVIQHMLPLDVDGMTQTLEGTVPVQTTQLLVTLRQGTPPHYVLTDCSGAVHPSTPEAFVTLGIQAILFQPPEAVQPQEITRDWMARQVRAQNRMGW